MSVVAVYDTMVYLQAATSVGRTHATFAAVADGRVTLCVSPALLEEIGGVLARPGVVARARMYDPVPRAFTLPYHSDDDHLFDLAIAAQARYLVTWESRLLALPGGATPATAELRRLAPDLTIVTPAQLAAILGGPAVL